MLLILTSSYAFRYIRRFIILTHFFYLIILSRAEKEKETFLYGLLVMVGIAKTTVTATATSTVFIQYQ